MDAERARALLLSLPDVVETQQWGERLVFWIADKTVGGKIFAIIDLGPRAGTVDPVMAFAASRERQAELLERDGLDPRALSGTCRMGRCRALERLLTTGMA